MFTNKGLAKSVMTYPYIHTMEYCLAIRSNKTTLLCSDIGRSLIYIIRKKTLQNSVHGGFQLHKRRAEYIFMFA